jgi:hypothetical protein
MVLDRVYNRAERRILFSPHGGWQDGASAAEKVVRGEVALPIGSDKTVSLPMPVGTAPPEIR